MIRRFFLLVSFVFLLTVPSASLCRAEEIIRLFEVDAKLSADRTLTVEESIFYDFGYADRHGIFRIIPEVYERDGGNYRLRLDIEEVTMDGQSVPYEVSREAGSVRVKIGDADAYVTGLHTYRIRYKTRRALNDFADHTEWYWNVTGNGWPVTIEQATMRLQAPSSTQHECFVGLFGSRDRRCRWNIAASMVSASSSRALTEYEGMTVVVGFPKEAFVSISVWERVWWFFQDNAWLALPFLTLFVMTFIWRKWGKEPAGRGTVIAHYEEPRGLPPGLQIALRHQHFSPRAVTATILDLARRGYLKVTWETEKAVVFVKEKDADEGLREFEKEIFEGVFRSTGLLARPSQLKATFHEAIDRARRAAFRELQTSGWFTSNPMAVRAIWIMIAVVFFAICFLFSDEQAVQIISSLISAIIIAGFGWQMPKMTKEGAIVAEEIEGFQRFLSVTETERLKFSDAPAKKPEQFARFLPAAVAFAVEKQWAEQFAGMMVPPPSYVNGSWNGWTSLQMVNAIDRMHHTTSSNMYSPPSSAGSGGSGFSGGGSGGGFGGGGGGSW